MKRLMTGNEAVARGAYEAGVSVAASYPGTPSTEITENIVRFKDVYAEWSPNEKVAAEVASGASIAGARSISCMKHVGMNVMADTLFTVSYIGVNGGLVFCVADDPGMHSSQNEQDSRHYAKASKVVMLEPSDSSECKEFTKLAYEISEKFDTPVILRLSTRVSHSQSLVCEQEPQRAKLKPYEKNIKKNVMIPENARLRHMLAEERMKKLAEYAENSSLNQTEVNTAEIGVITSGISYMYAKEALGESVSYLKLGMVYPLPKNKIINFVKNHEKVYVIEELDPFFEEYCKSIGAEVIGKEVFTMLGEYTPSMIKNAVLGKSENTYTAIDEEIPVRPPVMCAGCPHRGTFYVLSKMGLTVSGDIGCYTLGAAAPLSGMDTTVCMGASVSGAMGMARARGKEFNKKLVAVIGDSTFIHSGITGLIDIVYNKGTNTVIILDNSITAMTGHQDNPATGYTIRKEPTVKVNFKALAKSVGVKRIEIVDPFDTENFESVLKAELEADEPSVIIAQRPCALLKSVKYSGCCTITDKCRKCRQCVKTGCPAITVKDQNICIDKTICNGCGLCANICPFDAIEKEE